LSRDELSASAAGVIDNTLVVPAGGSTSDLHLPTHSRSQSVDPEMVMSMLTTDYNSGAHRGSPRAKSSARPGFDEEDGVQVAPLPEEEPGEAEGRQEAAGGVVPSTAEEVSAAPTLVSEVEEPMHQTLSYDDVEGLELSDAAARRVAYWPLTPEQKVGGRGAQHHFIHTNSSSHSKDELAKVLSTQAANPPVLTTPILTRAEVSVRGSGN
jgi:hypothetical protein